MVVQNAQKYKKGYMWAYLAIRCLGILEDLKTHVLMENWAWMSLCRMSLSETDLIGSNV